MPRLKQKNDPFDFPLWAEQLFTEETAIKRAKFILAGGGTFEIGIFCNTALDCTSGATLIRNMQGKVIKGTVCKTNDPTGLEWYQDIYRKFMLRTNCL